MHPRTQFWIASADKQFTSAAIMKCQEKGLLHLDDKLKKFFPNAPADKRDITILQLLTHTSGFGQSYASEGVKDRDTAVRLMLAEPLVDTPGLRFHYSNSNYQIAVAIVEVASGQAYRAFVRNNLWRPAGFRQTGFAGDTGSRSVAPARNSMPGRLQKTSWGGEGVYSSAGDLLKWHRTLQSCRILACADVHQLMTGVAQIEEGMAALGWFTGKTVRGTKRIFTRGNEDWGPNTLLYAYPDSDTVIIILTHAGSANDDISWSRLVHNQIEDLMSL